MNNEYVITIAVTYTGDSRGARDTAELMVNHLNQTFNSNNDMYIDV